MFDLISLCRVVPNFLADPFGGRKLPPPKTTVAKNDRMVFRFSSHVWFQKIWRLNHLLSMEHLWDRTTTS